MSGTHPSPRTSSPAPPAVEATDVAKAYGTGDKAVQALRSVSLTAQTGTVLGLLGPNGAGKSTLLKILTTLSTADSGRAVIAGIDVAADPAGIRRLIGFVPQKPSFDPNLTGRENLVLQSRVHGASRAAARARAAELLEQFSLTEAGDRVASKLSGGMQRKIDVALALVHRPSVLFLDEPSTGLDPEARSQLWGAIRALTATGGLTVLLTTHYLEEADRLADRVVIIDRGTTVAAGTPDELKDALSGDTVLVRLDTPEAAEQANSVLKAIAGVDTVRVYESEVHARTASGGAALPGIVTALHEAGIQTVALTVARPSLDEVYLHYTGRSYQSAAEEADRTVRKEAGAR